MGVRQAYQTLVDFAEEANTKPDVIKYLRQEGYIKLIGFSYKEDDIVTSSGGWLGISLEGDKAVLAFGMSSVRSIKDFDLFKKILNYAIENSYSGLTIGSFTKKTRELNLEEYIKD